MNGDQNKKRKLEKNPGIVLIFTATPKPPIFAATQHASVRRRKVFPRLHLRSSASLLPDPLAWLLFLFHIPSASCSTFCPASRSSSLPFRGLSADSPVYNTLMAGFIDCKNMGKALKLFDELRERCLVYDGVVHATLMEGYWKHGMVKEAMESYQFILDRQVKMKPRSPPSYPSPFITPCPSTKVSRLAFSPPARAPS